MSTRPHESPVFALFSSADRVTHPSESLDGVIRERILSISSTIPSGKWRNPDCMLATSGGFILQTLEILCVLAGMLVDGQHVATYIEDRFREVEETTDFSDFTLVDYLDEKRKALRALAEDLESNFTTMKEAWNTGPQPPRAGSNYEAALPRSDALQPSSTTTSESGQAPRPGFSMSPNSIPSGMPYSRVQAFPFPSVGSSAAAGQPQADPASQNVDDILASVARRGKGHHQCPYGLACTKGGVDASGSPVVFERNSTFKTHMQKHARQYRCNYPDCTNAGGFARPDQLARHQRNVHNVVHTTF